jgi:hypothetical protein
VMLKTQPEFQKLVDITNRVAVRFNRSRSTCILTSFALNNVLQRLGYNSRPLRIEAAVFPVEAEGWAIDASNGAFGNPVVIIPAADFRAAWQLSNISDID